MIVIGSNTSDNGQSRFTEDVSHFMELRQNRQLALLKRSAKKRQLICHVLSPPPPHDYPVFTTDLFIRLSSISAYCDYIYQKEV